MAFFFTGSAIAGKLIVEWNGDLLAAIFLSGLFGTLLAIIVGLPALRIRGLYLAVTTFAFELAMVSYFLNTRFFDWVPSYSERVERLPIFGSIDYSSTKGIYFITAISLVVALLAIKGLRESRTGRVLLALRDNEHGVGAFGISVIRAKLMAFGIAGFLAGCAGALHVAHQQAFVPVTNSSGLGSSIRVFIAAIVGGIGSSLGAILGSLFLFGTIWWLRGDWSIFATGFGILTVLLIAPGGISSLIYRIRDSALKQFAIKKNIDVPSLVADDLIPISAPTSEEANDEI